MFKKSFSFIVIPFLSFSITFDQAWACDSHTIPSLGGGAEFEGEAHDHPWFFDVTFEQLNWETRSARDAHRLHHEGHHVHNKTHEEITHFTLGAGPWQNVTVQADLPYVVRNSTEIDDHARLGEKETSEGLGDMNLLTTWRFLKQGENALGAVAGVSVPTGDTKEENSQGLRFEPELQPGSGAYDVTLGVLYDVGAGPLDFHGHTLYVIRSEGAQEFDAGDTFSASLGVDTLLGPWRGALEAKVGLDLHLDIEEKQTDHGQEMADSGGTTLLLGPTLTIKAGDHGTLFGNILFPVYQDLGGFHQELDFTWTGGAQVRW